jgi:hypothetical protein
MVRKVTIARFEVWRQDPANLDDFFERIATKPLSEVCREVNVPYTLMHALLTNDVALHARWDAVEKAKAHRYQEETIKLADECPVDRDHAAVRKLQIETRQWVAAKLDRDRFAEKVQHAHRHEHTIDLGDRLRRARERVLEQVPEAVTLGSATPAVVEPVALPAPSPAIQPPRRKR